MNALKTQVLRLANLRVILGLLLVLGALSSQCGRGTLAFFTSTASSTGNTLTAGQLKILLNGSNPTGTITFDTSTAKLKPGDVKYGFWTVQNDNSNSDAVTANIPNGNVTITRAQAISGQSNATNADALDGRLDIVIKDTTAVGAITSSATCATNFGNAGNVTLTRTAPLSTAPTSSANRTVLTNGTATTLFTDVYTINAGVTNNFCIQFTWIDGTTAGGQTLDDNAKQGSDTYTISFTARS